VLARSGNPRSQKSKFRGDLVMTSEGDCAFGVLAEG
jgi:hypothetical protein